jgi:excisionase family DNA binding protein
MYAAKDPTENRKNSQKITEVCKMEQEFLSVKQLANYLNCSEKFIRKHVASRRLPGMVKIGRVYRFRKSDVEKKLLSGQLLLEKR